MAKKTLIFFLMPALTLALCTAAPARASETRISVTIAAGGVGCGLGLFFYYVSSFLPDRGIPAVRPALAAWNGCGVTWGIPRIRAESPAGDPFRPRTVPSWQVDLFRWEF
ncbi:MAG: hypothetical protein JRF59_04365 [Deltaproteobacteria bacterium]|nr:hypothetical protein [Deltaproteobacteria bacterium]MBW1922180.1 hypothetical protein [Deltaproteobacteria bacterium]MBW1950229.1 hypothetical protein [Deltaproteobacteria bacterium]MBW2006837.1 hypothetical protein [Deltaproteobacteria bacterium]MBW2347061.1 hypothetical protein [Deltaproteobacteria bacterium]